MCDCGTIGVEGEGGKHTIKNVMAGDYTVVLTQGPTPYPSQFLHVSTHAKQKSQMHTQRTNVRPSLTTNPEDSQFSIVIEFEKFTLVNCADSQLAFYGADKRGTLEECASEIFDGAREGVLVGEGFVET